MLCLLSEPKGIAYSTFSTPSFVSIIGIIITSSFTTSAIVLYDREVVYCVMAVTIVTDRWPCFQVNCCSACYLFSLSAHSRLK